MDIHATHAAPPTSRVLPAGPDISRQALPDELIVECMLYLEEQDRTPPRLLALTRALPSWVHPLSRKVLWAPFCYNNANRKPELLYPDKDAFLARIRAKCPSGRFWLGELYTQDLPKDVKVLKTLEAEMVQLARLLKRGKGKERQNALREFERASGRRVSWTLPVWQFYLQCRHHGLLEKSWPKWHQSVPSRLWKRDDFVLDTAPFATSYGYWEKSVFSNGPLMREALKRAQYSHALCALIRTDCWDEQSVLGALKVPSLSIVEILPKHVFVADSVQKASAPCSEAWRKWPQEVFQDASRSAQLFDIFFEKVSSSGKFPRKIAAEIADVLDIFSSHTLEASKLERFVMIWAESPSDRVGFVDCRLLRQVQSKAQLDRLISIYPSLYLPWIVGDASRDLGHRAQEQAQREAFREDLDLFVLAVRTAVQQRRLDVAEKIYLAGDDAQRKMISAPPGPCEMRRRAELRFAERVRDRAQQQQGEGPSTLIEKPTTAEEWKRLFGIELSGSVLVSMNSKASFFGVKFAYNAFLDDPYNRNDSALYTPYERELMGL